MRIAIALLLMTQASWAQTSLPVADIAGDCTRNHPNNPIYFQWCMSTSKDAYEDLKSQWNQLPPQAKSICVKNRPIRQIQYYVAVRACIKKRLYALEYDRKRQFRQE